MSADNSPVMISTSEMFTIARRNRKRFYALIQEFEKAGGTVTFLEDKAFRYSFFYNFKITGPKDFTTAFIKATAFLNRA